MLAEQIIYAGLVCKSGEALGFIYRVLEVLGRAYCSDKCKAIGLPFLQSYREPHSVASLGIDPAHLRFLPVEHEHGRRAHAVHLRTGRGIQLVDQLRALAEARLRVAHLLRKPVDVLHLEGDVLFRSHLDHRHRVIRQMPQRHHRIAERRLALERDIGSQLGLAHIEDLVPS